jgi:hypothetical protein
MEPDGSLPCSQEPPLVRILIQMHPVHTFTFIFPKIHFNIIFPIYAWVVVIDQISVESFVVSYAKYSFTDPLCGICEAPCNLVFKSRRFESLYRLLSWSF